jgi:glutathione S-transferase
MEDEASILLQINRIKILIHGRTTVRFLLNYKKLAYKVVAHEYPDIENEYIKLGIPPNPDVKWTDGRPIYTSPSIIDNSKNTPITDSYAIAEYLDKAYPDTPKAIPPGTEALQAAFYAQYNQLSMSVYHLFIPRTIALLSPRSQEYIQRTRKEYFGMSLEDMEPKGEEKVKAWKAVEKIFDTLHGWLSKSQGEFFMGKTVSFADFVVGATLQFMKITYGEDSEEWNDVMTWNNGRWAAYQRSMEPYASTD